MSTTVADIIRLSLRTLGILAAEETPEAQEEQDAFDALNDMLASWSLERLVLFATQRTEYALTAGLSPHTIGLGGTFNTARPIRIDRASVVTSGQTGSETPISLLTDAEWQGTQGKTTEGTPTSLWVDSAYPLMSLYLLPIPNAAHTLVLYTWSQLGQFSDTSDTFDLPPGYARALRSNLAVELAPDYGVSVSGELAKIADESKGAIKRLNMRPDHLTCDPAITRGGFNIISGDK